MANFARQRDIDFIFHGIFVCMFNYVFCSIWVCGGGCVCVCYAFVLSIIGLQSHVCFNLTNAFKIGTGNKRLLIIISLPEKRKHMHFVYIYCLGHPSESMGGIVNKVWYIHLEKLPYYKVNIIKHVLYTIKFLTSNSVELWI